MYQLWKRLSCINFSAHRNELKEAYEEGKNLVKLDRAYLILLLKMLISGGHSLDLWEDLVLNSVNRISDYQTMLLFVYLDCDLLDEAKMIFEVSVLQCLMSVDNVNMMVFVALF